LCPPPAPSDNQASMDKRLDSSTVAALSPESELTHSSLSAMEGTDSKATALSPVSELTHPSLSTTECIASEPYLLACSLDAGSDCANSSIVISLPASVHSGTSGAILLRY